MPNRLFALCLCALLFACAVPLPDPAPIDPADQAVVYVIQRGWHTDVGLPVTEITAPLASLEAGFPGVQYLTFGFGERQYLVDGSHDIGVMLSALFPSHSGVLLTALGATPEAGFGAENVVALPVSRAGLARIEAAIWHEFELAPDGTPRKLRDGPYTGSVFYAGRDTYYGLFTCNTWSATTLRAGGVPMATAGVLFADQVMDMARTIDARHAAAH